MRLSFSFRSLLFFLCFFVSSGSLTLRKMAWRARWLQPEDSGSGQRVLETAAVGRSSPEEKQPLWASLAPAFSGGGRPESVRVETEAKLKETELRMERK